MKVYIEIDNIHGLHALRDSPNEKKEVHEDIVRRIVNLWHNWDDVVEKRPETMEELIEALLDDVVDVWIDKKC